MKLLTKPLRKDLALYSGTNPESDDPLVVCKFLTPDAGWTWYVTEFDGHDLFFGFVVGVRPGWGSSRLSELLSIRGRLGLPVERDLWFRPCRFSELKGSIAEFSA